MQRWEAPDTFGGVSARQLLNIQRLVGETPDKARKHQKSPLWVGKLVAHVLGRSTDDPGDVKIINKMVGTWCANGALRTVDRANAKREIVEYIEVG